MKRDKESSPATAPADKTGVEPISSSERALFRAAVKQLEPAPADPAAPAPTPGEARRRDRARPDTASAGICETEFSFRRSGVSIRHIKRLCRGGYAVQKELDLHGQTRESARLEVQAFLKQCGQNRYWRVRIIHGKGLHSPGGNPVLKGEIGSWLKQSLQVMAYWPSSAGAGASGALDILLKRGPGKPAP